MGLVRELAAYEGCIEEVITSETNLARALFHAQPHVFCHVAVVDDENRWNRVVVHQFLDVDAEHRGLGIGRTLLETLATVCVDRRYAPLEWSVLDWNTSSIDSYRSLGAGPMAGWTAFRLSGDALNLLESLAAT